MNIPGLRDRSWEDKGAAFTDEEVGMIDDKQNERLDSTLEQGKNELDKAVADASETARTEALALGYVELIEIILTARRVDFRVDLESYYNIYEAYRTKRGEYTRSGVQDLFGKTRQTRSTGYVF